MPQYQSLAEAAFFQICNVGVVPTSAFNSFAFLFFFKGDSSEFVSHLVFLPGLCGVIEQKDEGGQQPDTACGAQTQPGHAGLCEYDAFFFYFSSFFLDHDAAVVCAALS